MALSNKTTILLLLLLLVSDLSPASSAKERSARRRKKRDVSSDLEEIRKTLETLSRQVMEQQNLAEERTRTDGDSGVKVMRQVFGGTRPYHAAAQAEDAMSSIHEHAETERTVGMGEIVAVLNGVEFRSRHNDYRLISPRRNSSDYHATDPISYPPVPDNVARLRNVNDQIKEMKEFFQAFKEQNISHRDYRPYFRPILCYLEGAWTKSIEGMDEPFFSERHFLNADSWNDLEQKNRYTMYSGRKEPEENFGSLPRKVFNINENGLPEMAQWNYRILCHSIYTDLPVSHLRVVDDLGPRMAHGRTLDQHANSRHARFQINPDNLPYWEEKITNRTYLDWLMEQVPGKNNYVASLGDWAFENPARQAQVPRKGDPMTKNTGFYHRYYRVKKPRGSGTELQHRGFSDSNVFMAMTSHPKVVPTNLTMCTHDGCKTVIQRWTYAIPLEIIYLTPLFKWNPYRLRYKGHYNSLSGKAITDNGARDGLTRDKAFRGVNSMNYYMTPAEFIDQTHTTAADTSFRERYVMDPWNNVKHVAGSGQRIFAEVRGVGKIRLRYPVAPLYGEGNPAWKEIDALKDILLHPHKYSKMFQEPLTCRC